jgi:hypothetical protein
MGRTTRAAFGGRSRNMRARSRPLLMETAQLLRIGSFAGSRRGGMSPRLARRRRRFAAKVRSADRSAPRNTFPMSGSCDQE